MPAEYRIDRERRTVFSVVTGVIDDTELLGHQRRLATDPAFRADMDQLSDFTGVTEVAVTSDGIRSLAHGNPFGPGSRRALVIDQVVGYGLARMFQQLTDEAGHEIRIFEHMAEARAWLGLDSTAR